MQKTHRMSENKNNRFPIEIYPEPVETYINEVYDKQGLNKDFLGVSFLGLAATLIGNRYCIEHTSYTQSAMLWIALVGSSSTKKTPVLKTIFAPLEELDSKYHKEFKEAYAKYLEYKDSLDPLKEPIERQLIGDDFTIEQLYVILANNPLGMIVKRDELLGLIYDSGRYTGGGGTEQKFLSLYSGESVRINRKKDNESVKIENAFLNLIGGIQPKLLNELFAKNRDASGFIQRVLFCFPEKMHSKPPNGSVDQLSKDRYTGYCREFLRLPVETCENGEGVKPKRLKLCKEAKNLYFDWLTNWVYPIINDKDRGENEKTYVGKLEGVGLRLSLVMEVMHCDEWGVGPKEISAQSMKNSIWLCHYFFETYLRVLKTVHDKPILNPKTLAILNAFMVEFKKGLDIKAFVNRLINEGYSYAQIADALVISKGVISKYKS